MRKIFGIFAILLVLGAWPSTLWAQTATNTSTPTRTSTVTATATQTATVTATATNTGTVTVTRTRTITGTPTRRSTYTATATGTVTRTATVTRTFTHTPTVTKTRTATYTKTATFTRTPIFTATTTRTPTVTQTATITPTASATATTTKNPFGRLFDREPCTSAPCFSRYVDYSMASGGISTLSMDVTGTAVVEFYCTPKFGQSGEYKITFISPSNGTTPQVTATSLGATDASVAGQTYEVCERVRAKITTCTSSCKVSAWVVR